MASPGVFRIIEASDIRGDNNASALRGEKNKERLLIERNGIPVMFPGEPCAIVVADTQQHAEHAARLVEVLYDEDGTSDDHLLPTNVAEAVRRGVFFPRNERNAHLERHDGGFADVSAALAAAPASCRGILNCGTQKHFPMETHTALAVPEEAGK